MPRPAKELKGFARVKPAAGETRHVILSLDARAFAFHDVAAKALESKRGDLRDPSW